MCNYRAMRNTVAEKGKLVLIARGLLIKDHMIDNMKNMKYLYMYIKISRVNQYIYILKSRINLYIKISLVWTKCSAKSRKIRNWLIWIWSHRGMKRI